MSSTSVEPSESVNQKVVRSDREELENDRMKRSKTDLTQWFEEQLGAHTKWSIEINGVLGEISSKHHNVAFVDTKAFGQVLVIDGKLKCAEADEYIFHENLVHHALLQHHNPKKVFIMGGGDGSTAREVLKYHKLKKVVMCDIDKEVVEFCKIHLTQNMAAFADPRLHIVINDAKAELERSKEKYDVIIGDLGDPIIGGGPSNRLYTKSFYQQVVKPKLKKHGIFVTQAGLAGVLSHKEIFSPIYNTMKQVFGHVIAYTAPMPSYADTRGWVLGMDKPTKLDSKKASRRMKSRMRGEMNYLGPSSIASAHILNKTLLNTLLEETRVIRNEKLKFCHGDGIGEDGGSEEGGSDETDPFVGSDAMDEFMEEEDEDEDEEPDALEGVDTHDPFKEGVGENDPEASAKGGDGHK